MAPADRFAQLQSEQKAATDASERLVVQSSGRV